MRASRRGFRGVLVLAAGLALSACAAGSAFRQGQKAAKNGDWDVAVARLTLALQKDPEDISYKIALENARIQASRHHYDEARKHLAAEELEKAAEELEIASNFDPGNKSASDDLLLVRERIRKRDEDKQLRTDLEAMKARAQATRVPVAVLSPRSTSPITLKFTDQSLQKIFDALGRLAGVNIVYDSDFRDKRWSLDVSNVTFEDALNQITKVNRLFYKILDPNTVIIAPESPQKRRSYDDNLVRTFYLENADVNETLTLVKTVAGLTKAAGNPTLGAITVTGTPDELALAARIVELNDKVRGEVLVEVRILEVSRNKLKDYGIQLANYQVGATFSPTGAANEVAGSLTNVRAHLLSSLNLADFIVSLPSSIFARFFQTGSNVKILASPRLRAAEGKKTTLKIGTEVPIPVTTFTATQAGASSFAPATSFQYRNVGVNMDLTPKVNPAGDITLEISTEFSVLGDDRNVGTGNNPLVVPTFLTRNINGTLRVRDGETSLIGGLLQGRQAESLSGALGVQSVPILNKILSGRTKREDQTEILISITPHIVRAPKVTESDLAALYIGTKETVAVPSSHPPLFGTPEEAPPHAAPSSPPPAPPQGEQAPEASHPDATGAATSEPSPPAPSPSPTPSPGAPGSQSRVIFAPPVGRLKVGDSGSVSLVLMGAKGVESVDMALSYDPQQFEAMEVDPGPLLVLDGAAVTSERNLEAGRAVARFARPTATSGAGAIATLRFKALQAGSAKLTLQSLTVGNGGGEEHPTLPGAWSVEVTP